MMRLLALFAALVAALVVATACGETTYDGAIEIPYEAVEALDNYAFTSKTVLSSAQGDLEATFDGIFQAPDGVQGTLKASGELWEQFGLPSEMDVVVIGDRSWWREPGGDWPPDAAPEEFSPFSVFSAYATPQFYLEALQFDSLRLFYGGSFGKLNGVKVLPPVSLGKSALIELLDEGTFAQEAGKDASIVREDAEAFLPEDILIQTWIAEKALYPVRILITLSSEGYEGNDFFLKKPFDIRLQLDITDADADVDIEPPL